MPASGSGTTVAAAPGPMGGTFRTRGWAKGSAPRESLYLAVDDLQRFHRRALDLRSLDPGFLHGDPSSPFGKVGPRPWGERSYYTVDPSGHTLRFVDSRTAFTGTAAQTASLRRSARGRTDRHGESPRWNRARPQEEGDQASAGSP